MEKRCSHPIFVQKLNEQIRSASIYGDSALELRDQRNVFIDELSTYVKIDVLISEEPLDEYSSVEKLVISLADTGNPPINLVDGIYAAQFELPEFQIDAQGNFVTDANGDTIPNFVKGSDKNQYLLNLTAMTDSKGRYKKNFAHQDITDKVILADTTLYGALQASRELLTEKGEFASAADLAADPDANIKRGIPYYQHALDALAKKFAEAMNTANKMGATATIEGIDGFETEKITLKDGNNLGLPAGEYEFYKVIDGCALTGLNLLKDLSIFQEPPYTDTNPAWSSEQIQQLQTEQLLHLHDFQHGYSTTPDLPGGNLFSISSSSDDSEGINASNISISKSWSIGDVRILTSKKLDANNKPLSTANENVNHIISLLTSKMDYRATDVTNAYTSGKYFTGTFQEFFASVTNTLAADTQTSTALYNNYDAAALELNNDRSSVSGVDLNEEATNMMQYQKSYSAACRLLTTIDTMLDKLINGTAV